MFHTPTIDSTDKASFYRDLAAQMSSIFDGEKDHIANAANCSALLFDQMPDLNWAGFYFLSSPDELVVGPFQGKPACVRIKMGKGVCGSAALRKASILVEDVDAFPGHIACDSASRSELVVPLIKGDAVLGVIDLDSPRPARFDAADQAGIEAIAALYVAACATSV